MALTKAERLAVVGLAQAVWLLSHERRLYMSPGYRDVIADEGTEHATSTRLLGEVGITPPEGADMGDLTDSDQVLRLVQQKLSVVRALLPLR
jgi:hypothetical protein